MQEKKYLPEKMFEIPIHTDMLNIACTKIHKEI